MPLSVDRAIELLKSGKCDDRLRQRFPISLDISYGLVRGSLIKHVGRGRTVNMSSRGVLFEASDVDANKLPRGRNKLRLEVNWPAPQNGTQALSLVVWGRIVRRENRLFAVTIEQHEFYTSESPITGNAPP